MKSVLTVRNSFCKLSGFPEDVMALIDEILTYQNDIEAEKAMLFKKLKHYSTLAKSNRKVVAAKGRKMVGWTKKQIKELEATEFVKWLKDDTFPTGHLNIVKDVLAEIYPKYEIKDRRVVPEKQFNFNLCEPFHDPRYYQSEMHEIGMREHRGVFESAVGTGKSLVLMRLLLHFGVKSLIVVPSKPLMNQLKKALTKHFGRRNVIVVDAKKLSDSKMRKLKKIPIRLINIQSLASLNKKKIIKDYIDDIHSIYIDEIHHAGAASYTSLLPALEHIYYRFGFTGTFLRNDEKTLDMWGFLSNRLYVYKAYKAIQEGYLTPVKFIWHNLEGTPSKAYQKEYKKNYCGNPELLEKIKEIITTQVKENEQVLILVARKEQSGKIIHDFLEDLGLENTYISGDDDKDTIDEALEAFNNKEIRILVGSTVIGEGIDITSTDHLIMAQGGKSEIAMVQAIGRAVRLYPGKSIAYVHDFNFRNTHYMTKHASLRKIIYKNNFEV